ncbi:MULTISPECIES: sensor histidine kinase [Bacillus]|uniref:sensor histidine kinase n=1 Tax=Bacillus TaxID=1386 RepID=UPI000BB85366|nr:MULTISPECIES: histidine kinase [Bacillus]
MFKKSIRNRLIVLLLIATIIPFGTSIIITYYHTKESFKDLVVQENTNLLYQGKINLENYLSDLNGLTLSVYNNPEFMNYLRSSNKEANYLNINVVKSVLQTILYAEENIKQVTISLPTDNRKVTASKRSTVVFSNEVSLAISPAFQDALDSPYNIYIEAKNGQVNQSDNSIYLHRVLTNVPSDQVLAYITLKVSLDKIFDLGENLYNPETEELYIISSERDFLYSSVTLEKNGEYTWIDYLQNDEANTGSITWQDEAFNGVMLFQQVPPSVGGWLLVKRVPYTTLYESAFNVTKINILFGLIGLSLVILSTLFISFRITSPIRVLLQNIQQVEEGNMKVKIQPLGKDEIGILSDRFQQMMDKLNHLINREYKLKLENKTNQLKVLQSQINPHFLFNALQSIGTVALKNNVPQVYSLINHLSKIMRYGMNVEEDLVPLKKEINYTKAFLHLQKERFGESLDYHLYVDESLLHVHVPKMILQPIIENYFKHGFENRDGVGEIVIYVEKAVNYIELIVIDNGTGISEERMKEINAHFMHETLQPEREDSNIGLKNIRERLRLYYNDLASLSLTNRQEGGLVVTIKLPMNVVGEKYESFNS